MCLFCEIDRITSEFRLLPGKWGETQNLGASGGLVTYNFASDNLDQQTITFDSFITEESFQDEIVLALSYWEEIANLNFTISAHPEDADIRFGWQEIDGPGGVLGTATLPASGPLSNVIVVFDSEEDWFLHGDAPQNKIDFSATAAHEIGHAIGIDHSDELDSLMHANYSTTIFKPKQDDINAAVEIYGAPDFQKVEVFRFYNPQVGNHLFTVSELEKQSIEEMQVFNFEGIGFLATLPEDVGLGGSIPIYRFFNSKIGSHFFTADENEKTNVMALVDFEFEGVGFGAFSENTASTVPIYRFFNTENGGHFFTASDVEKNSVMNIQSMRFEGEVFFAFPETTF
jgi:hypothetical protein